MVSMFRRLSVACLLAAVPLQSAYAFDDGTASAPASNAPRKDASSANSALITKTVEELLKLEENGEWPYEGVYRVPTKDEKTGQRVMEIPVGYRIGGTAIVGMALLYGASAEDAAAAAAIDRGVASILKLLEHPLMQPSTDNVYDVRVWGHSFALEYFCRLREQKRLGQHEKAIQLWIPKLVATLIQEELEEGGWNYAGRFDEVNLDENGNVIRNNPRNPDEAKKKAAKTVKWWTPASFVTSPISQAMLLAKSQGEKIPDALFDRAATVLQKERLKDGTFLYSGMVRNELSEKARQQVEAREKLPGSIARSAVCEVTLQLLTGKDNKKEVKAAIQAFHKYWDELEKRRKKTGTHVPPYNIAPYYFYYGHRYAAQAIEFLPEADRAAERASLKEVILRTRDENGTWNDRVFPRSASFGTAMMVLALLGEQAPKPARKG